MQQVGRLYKLGLTITVQEEKMRGENKVDAVALRKLPEIRGLSF